MSKQEVIIVLANTDAGHGSAAELSALDQAGSLSSDAGDIAAVLKEFDVELGAIFGAQPEKSIEPSVAFNGAPDREFLEELPEIDPDELAEDGRYFSTGIDEERAEDFVARMRALSQVETAYVVPPTILANLPFSENLGQDEPTEVSTTEGTVPDFVARQTYLAPSPHGIGAARVWNVAGGRGGGVRIIDIEHSWKLDHVDLQRQGAFLAGKPKPHLHSRNHGTATLGLIAAVHDNKGVHGIAPDALVRVVSDQPAGSSWGLAGAIEFAASRLRPGDVLLLEVQRWGPNHNPADPDDQNGAIAVEWWPEIFRAIRRAVARGVVVIEAAGNGEQDLDDPVYNIPHPGFPHGWRNPFQSGHDSGAILVGAGAPSIAGFGPPRSRLYFSNYGSRVDCQAWGAAVTTTGYGNLYKGRGETEFFTHTYGGTSSASAVVAAAISQVQGVCHARSKRFGPRTARRLVRDVGPKQKPSSIAPVSQNIGRQPDVEAMIKRLFGVP